MQSIKDIMAHLRNALDVLEHSIPNEATPADSDALSKLLTKTLADLGTAAPHPDSNSVPANAQVAAAQPANTPTADPHALQAHTIEDQLRIHIAQLDILHQIDQGILIAATIPEIGQVALQLLRNLIPFQWAAINIFDRPAMHVESIALYHEGDTPLPPLSSDGLAALLQEEQILEQFQQGKPVIIPDLLPLTANNPRNADLTKIGVRSLISLPLQANGELLGSLSLYSKDWNGFPESNIFIVQEVSRQLAIALQQAQLLETERDQRTLAEALRDSTVAISGTLNLDDVFERILTNIRRVVPYDGAVIMLIEDGVTRTALAHGWEERGHLDWIMKSRFSVNHILRWVRYFLSENPQAFTVADTESDIEWIKNSANRWVRSFAEAPIFYGGQLIGVLHLDSTTPHFFRQVHLDRLQAFANQAAVAVHNAQLFQAEHRRREIAETLVRASGVLNSTLELNQVLELILHELQRVIRYDTASLQVRHGDELIIIAGHGFSPEQKVIGLRFPNDPTLPNTYVITQRKPLAVSNVRDKYPHFETLGDQYMSKHIETWLGLPLLSKDRVVGMIAVDRCDDRPFTDDDIYLATAFANQAAAALENAQLYEMIQRHAEELEHRVIERTAELERANEELRVLSKIKDEFVSNVSHELRTPITSLKLRHYLIARQPERLAIHLDVLERETERLRRIIEDLLTLSRMDQGHTTLQRSLLDLNAVMQQLVADRIPISEQRTLQLELQCTPEPLWVEADAGLLEQAASVLLTNALNYTPANGRVTVRTETTVLDGVEWACFSIQDTGIGIPQDEQSKLFTRFFRGETGKQSGMFGTGLGLSIAKEIVDRHDGRITFHSSGIPGEGTTFTVWLIRVLEPVIMQ